MMAALKALDTGLVAATALARPDLALSLAGRECERVQRFGKGAPPGLMEHMAAYVTASGGLSAEQLKQAAKAESEAIGRHHPQGWGVLADAVADALRVDAGATAVEPDVVGEALLLRVWGGPNTAAGCKATVRAAQTRPRQVAAAVIRSARDYCVGENPYDEPLAWLDALIAKGSQDLALLWNIESELPLQTLALRERAAKLDALLAAALRKSAKVDESSRPQLAQILNNHGVSLSALGRREEALEAAAEAVALYRQLAAQRPDAFLPDLAGSLNNQGSMLSALGRREEALEAAAEAVTLYRELAAQRPDAFLPDLAMSLNNQGNRLSALGRREKALEATAEAVRRPTRRPAPRCLPPRPRKARSTTRATR